MTEEPTKPEANEAEPEQPKGPTPGIAVDGAFYTTDDFAFGEQILLVEHVRSLLGDPQVTHEHPITGERVTRPLDLNDLDETNPALFAVVVFLVRRRTNDKYEIQDALKLKPADMEKMREEAEVALNPPQPAGA